MKNNKEIVRALYEKHINNHSIDTLKEVVSSDYKDLVSGNVGLKAYQENIQTLFDGFPDIKFNLEDVIEEGDKVVARWNWKGTHKGLFGKMPASGKTVKNVGVVIFTMKNGMILNSWALVDRLSVMQQISQ